MNWPQSLRHGQTCPPEPGTPAVHPSPEYMTTKEVADLLRLKERRVYDLASAGEIPCTRALGKLLFRRSKIEAWLSSHDSGVAVDASPRAPRVFLGSHDPLLDWVLRESESGLATFFDGSLDGLERFGRSEGIGTGLHIYSPGADDWNVPAVTDRFAGQNVVLVEWAWRQRGLIVAPGNPKKIERIVDITKHRIVPRQSSAGSQQLLQSLLETDGIGPQTLDLAAVARTEVDAALAVAEGQADVAFGLQSVAHQLRLDFVPVVRERFDLLVNRADWFDPPFQRVMDFARTAAFAERAAAMPGYDVSGLGRVRFNPR